jgi:WD40 repeat protein
LRRWTPDEDQPDLRGWEWHFLNEFAHRESQEIDLTSRQAGSHIPIVFSMDFSPDGSVLAYASSDTIVILDAKRKLELFRLPPHQNLLQSIRFSHDGELLASASDDGKLQVWDWKNQRSVYTLSRDIGLGAVSWHPNDRELAVITNGMGREKDQLLVIDWRSGEIKHTVSDKLDHHARETGYSSDGKYFAMSLVDENRDFEIVVYETENWTIKYRKSLHDHYVYCIAWHPDDELIASASLDGTVSLWNFRTDESKIIARSQEGFPGVAWSSSGEFLAIAGWDHSLRVWELANDRVCQTLRGHDSLLRCVSWHPNKLELASVDWSGRLNIYNFDIVPAIQTLIFPPLSFAQETQYLNLQWHPGGELLAAGNIDDAFVWHLQPFSLKPKREVADRFYRPEWNVAGSLLAMSQLPSISLVEPRDGVWFGNQGVRRAIELASGLKFLSWDSTGQNMYLTEIDMNALSFLWLLPIEGDSSPRKIAGPFLQVFDIDISPDRNYAALAIRDDFTPIIDLRSEEVVRKLPDAGFGYNCVVAWSPDSRYLACAGENQVIEIWDTTTWKLTNELAGHTFRVTGLSWNRKYNRLASASRDKTIRVWDINTFRTVIVLQHDAEIGAVQWSPDGQRLASIDRGGEVKIWDASKSYADVENQQQSSSIEFVTD